MNRAVRDSLDSVDVEEFRQFLDTVTPDEFATGPDEPET